MAKRERVLRVFVAAPNDADGEVETLRKIVEKLNQNHDPEFCRYLYALAWADWFDEFRVPVELKAF